MQTFAEPLIRAGIRRLEGHRSSVKRQESETLRLARLPVWIVRPFLRADAAEIDGDGGVLLIVALSGVDRQHHAQDDDGVGTRVHADVVALAVSVNHAIALHSGDLPVVTENRGAQTPVRDVAIGLLAVCADVNLFPDFFAPEAIGAAVKETEIVPGADGRKAAIDPGQLVSIFLSR